MTTVCCDWDAILKGDPREGLHWHGFVWVGSAGARSDFKRQAERTLGTAEFAESTIPPEMTGWYLAKRRLVKATFTDLDAVAAWLREQRDARPPTGATGRPCGPDCHIRYAVRTLSHGKDDVWSWPIGTGSEAHIATICCPNEFWPDLPCPAPPRP
jgi:hypothetical protein